MHDVVMEQGTIVDRIDYNMDTALKHTKKGVRHLKKVRFVSIKDDFNLFSSLSFLISK